VALVNSTIDTLRK